MSGDVQDADRFGTSDALLRLAAGIDEGDATLIASAFVPQAIVDFGPCGEKVGLPFPPLEGREAIVGFLAGTSLHQITSHVVTNVRVTNMPKGAEMRALVEATHIVRADPSRRFRMLDRYVAELVLNAGDWQIEQLVIDNIWFEGNPRIMLHRSE